VRKRLLGQFAQNVYIGAVFRSDIRLVFNPAPDLCIYGENQVAKPRDSFEGLNLDLPPCMATSKISAKPIENLRRIIFHIAANAWENPGEDQGYVSPLRLSVSIVGLLTLMHI